MTCPKRKTKVFTTSQFTPSTCTARVLAYVLDDHHMYLLHLTPIGLPSSSSCRFPCSLSSHSCSLSPGKSELWFIQF